MCSFLSPSLAQGYRIVAANPLGSTCDGCRLHVTTDRLPSTLGAPYSIEWEGWSMSSDFEDDFYKRGVYDPARGYSFPELNQPIDPSSTGKYVIQLTIRSHIFLDSVFVFTDTISTSCHANSCLVGDFSFTQLSDTTFQLAAAQIGDSYDWSAFDIQPVSGSHNQSITPEPLVSGLLQEPVFHVSDEGYYRVLLKQTSSDGCLSSCEKEILLAPMALPNSSFTVLRRVNCSRPRAVINISGNFNGNSNWQLRFKHPTSPWVVIATQNAVQPTFNFENVNNITGHLHRKTISVRRQFFNPSTGLNENQSKQFIYNAAFVGTPGQVTNLSTVVGAPGTANNVFPVGSFQTPANTTPYRVFVTGELVIDINYTFNNIVFLMGDGAKVTVNPNVAFNTANCFFKPQGLNEFLTINDPTNNITPVCNCLWNGLLVDGQYTDNSSSFDRANQAIQLQTPAPTLSLSESTFFRNQIGVRVDAQFNLPVFSGLTFTGRQMSYLNTCSYQPAIFNHSFAGVANFTNGITIIVPPSIGGNSSGYNLFNNLSNGYYAFASDLFVTNSLFTNFFRFNHNQGIAPQVAGNAVVVFQRSRNILSVEGFGFAEQSVAAFSYGKDFITVFGNNGEGNIVRVQKTRGRSHRGISINRPAQSQSSSTNQSEILVKFNNFTSAYEMPPADQVTLSMPLDNQLYSVFLNHSYDGALPTTVFIDENKFNVDQPVVVNYNPANGIIVNQAPNTNMQLDISNNQMYLENSINGIFLNDVVNGQVNENAISVNSELATTNVLKGAIHVVGGNNNQLYCNHIVGDNDLKYYENAGILLDFTVNPVVLLNEINGMDHNIQIENICEQTKLVQNDLFGDANIKLLFGVAGALGLSISPFPVQVDYGNYFLQPTPSWGTDMVNLNPSFIGINDPQLGYFLINGNESEQKPQTYLTTNGSSVNDLFLTIDPNPINPIIPTAVNEDCADLPEIEFASGGGSSNGTELETTLGNALEVVIRSLANDSTIISSEDLLATEATGLLALRNLLKSLDSYPDQSVVTDLIGQIDALKLEELSVDNYNQIMALHTTIDSLLLNRSYLKDQKWSTFNTALNSYEPELDPTSAEKFVLEQLAQFKFGQGTITTSDIELLTFVANQCIAQYGQSVLHARNLLAMVIGTFLPNIKCSAPAARVVLNPQTESSRAVVALKPNPADSHVLLSSTLEYHRWSLYHATGALVVQGSGDQIHTADLTNGMYIVTLELVNGQRQAVKLVVNH
jgi:hypothetical protein